MKNLLFSLAALFAAFTLNAQDTTGSIAGILTDAEMGNEPLAFANVFIKDTTIGTTSDFDGLYEIANLEPGTYTVVFSYLGYETVEIPNVSVEAGKVTTINIPLAASSGVALEEVIVTTVARKDSQVALLLDQRKAIEIKESIGAQELAQLAVSDAASATQKISGVSQSEASGDIFVRGLGDRYLVTTLNGLPVPSDDVDKKNIDLSLFPTRFIEAVSIQKTFDVRNSADQSSGAINVESRSLSGSSELGVSFSSGVNTNVLKDGVFDNFRVSPNYDQSSLGYFDAPSDLQGQILNQSWNTVKLDNPIDYSASITAGKRFANDKLALFFTGSHSKSNNHKIGVFRQFRSNALEDTITDATTFETRVVNTALADLTYNASKSSKFQLSSFYIHKLSDDVFEGGREGKSSFFEETATGGGLHQFVRDQNTKQTTVFVTQLAGVHKIGELNTIRWAGGYNLLNADEPNRIRNEVNIDPNDQEPWEVQLGLLNPFQQRKSAQLIEDVEYNGYIINEVKAYSDEEDRNLNLSFGATYRDKTRDFSSEFVGVKLTSQRNPIYPTSIDAIGDIFTAANFENDILRYSLLGLNANDERKDIYNGSLVSVAGFGNVNWGTDDLNLNVGVRMQSDRINVTYDIGNLFPRTGESDQKYSKLYPSLSLKKSFGDKLSLRAAFSKTITLPEFKEIAPFEYVSPNGQVTAGNPNLEASTDLNYDVKFEFFPSNDQLVSIAGFYKQIENPINKVRMRSAGGVFSFFNSGEEATVAGIELESKINLAKREVLDSEGFLVGGYKTSLVFNATRMWHNQDLRTLNDEQGNLAQVFYYADKKEIGLQGASDYILNLNLNYATLGEKPFTFTASANYADDKIFALGTPENQSDYDYIYNAEIIEKGFALIDGIIGKQLNKTTRLQLVVRNLLDPDILQTQAILRNFTDFARADIGLAPYNDKFDSNGNIRGYTPEERIAEIERIEEDVVVNSYKLGRSISLGLTVNF